jgi:FtsP/CotA-like multicopper oxidase with cupredoxin domain
LRGRSRAWLVGVILAAALGCVVAGTGVSAAGSTAKPSAKSASGRSACHKNVPPLIHDGFPEPPLRYSRNGVLNTTLRASVSPVMINHHRVVTMNYDGSFPGPALVVCDGDKLVVHLVNDLSQPTNLHTHGFHVSPSGHSDNIFLRINPGQRFTYTYHLPSDNAPGSYWYHPHVHMFVEGQIFAGLAGPIVVEGGLDTVPALRKFPQRWIFLMSTQVKNGKTVPVGSSKGPQTPIYVNGDLNPTLKIRPGQIQRWRIFNANADRIVVLRLAGQPFQVLAEDANTLQRARTVRELQIAPGSRRDVLVRGGRPGNYTLKALPFEQFPGANSIKQGGWRPNQTLLTVRSTGRVAHDRFPTGALPHPGYYPDYRGQHIDRRRTIVFSEMQTSPTNTNYLLNGQMFDPNQIAVTMKLGALEQWTLVNTNVEWHTFHIHINDFQVVSVAGKRVPYVDYQDNVALPPKSKVVILMRPTDFTGKFVMHCHVTFHEDHGMMAAVQVVRNLTADQARASVSEQSGLQIASSAYESATIPVALSPTQFALYCRLHHLHVAAPGANAVRRGQVT